MNTDAWMPFYPGDYLRDTMHLNTEEHGAYLLLLFCFWFGNGKMEDNDHQFANITRMSVDRWKQHFRPILSKFFIIQDGQWVQKRVQAEKLKANHNSKVRSESGKLGGRPKKQTESKHESKTKANVKRTETPSPSPSPSLEREREAIVPTLEEVRTWASIDGLTVDQADAFFRHYDGLNWMYGNTPIGNPRQWLAKWREKSRAVKRYEEVLPVRNAI